MANIEPGTEAYRLAREEWERMNKVAKELGDDFAERMKPALEAINATISGPSFQLAMQVFRENKAMMDQINEANVNAWTRLLNTVDLRPIIALEENLKPHSFPRNDWHDNEEEPSTDQKKIEETVNRIEEQITRINEDDAGKVYLVLKSDGRLLDRDNKDSGRPLSPQLRKLVARLVANCTSTSRLTLYSGYKNDETTRRGIQRLNRYGFGILKLPVQIAVGEQDEGYRLAKCIRLKVEEQQF